MGPASQSTQSAWSEFRRALRASRAVVAAGLAGGALIARSLEAWMPPAYVATARLEVLRPGEALAQRADHDAGPAESEAVRLYTTAALITRRGLLERIDEDFTARDWLDPGVWSGAPAARLRSLARSSGGFGGLLRTPLAYVARRTSSTAAKRMAWLVTIVHVEPVPGTRLIDIKVDHPDPNAAMSITNRLAERFVEDAGSPVKIVDRAWAVPRHVRPRGSVRMAIWMMIGALGGGGLALVRHRGWRTIREPEDVEDRLRLTVLGVLPRRS